MSEPVKKLHEVLEGIAGDENIEISLIDDLKELSQFIATTGQCLILASNAKKCATFLQENKSMLAKNQCKTILFSPKEIPAKTLIKFTKVGLTESILESTPPKTFLYKVKLLMRSIKTAKPQEEAEKVVKSIETNKPISAEEAELEIKNKSESQANTNDQELIKKKKFNSDDDNVLDYGANLKGKIKPQEESIDTHWKSDRKKNANDNGYEEENSKVELLEDENAIDMYLRGKNKKSDIIGEEEDENLRSLKSIDQEIAQEAQKKKSNYQDVIDEGSIKQKRLDQPDLPAEDENKSPTLDDLDLLFEEALKKKKKEDIEAEATKERKKLFEQIEDTLEKEKEKFQEEDLGGHLKGKIAKTEEIAEEEITQENKEYDNSELENSRKKNKELNLEEAALKKSKKDDITPEDTNTSHEGEVDKIDGNMIGNEGTVDKIRTRMEGRSDGSKKDLDEQTDSQDLYARKKKNNEENNDENDKNKLEIDKTDNSEDKKRELNVEDESNKDYREKSVNDLKLEPGKEKEAASKQLDDSDDLGLSLKSLEEPTLNERERQTSPQNLIEEKEQRQRDLNNPQFAKTRTHTTHEGNVEKIDSFYRGGDAKKKEHSWDNLTEKTTTLELINGTKGSRSGNGPDLGTGKDLGEQTIDYRKLKEEFDSMASGWNQNAEGQSIRSINNQLKNDDDEGSFKVVEIDPKSLDFSISIINSIYTKEIKPKQILNLLAQEILSQYQGIPIFYSYKLSEKKFSESYSMFSEASNDKVSTTLKEWWIEKKNDKVLFEHFQEKSMSTWRCEEIIKNDVVWEDVELPSWAEQELKSKAVELIFPYFDGIDRMGMAYIYFPSGIDPKSSNSILTVLEMARTVFLDTIERYKVQPLRDTQLEDKAEAHINESKPEEKKTVLGFFSGLFGKKKAS
ncbi:MAG: hypothetical protein HOP07_02195 [Bacteriovoracaceae bacterium]|nr:hypothetical protein [Bacteriovoracaceae bacterium]